MSELCSSCEILATDHTDHTAHDLIVYVEAFGEAVEVRYFYVAPDRSGATASGGRYCRSGADAVAHIAELVDGSSRGIENVGRVRITGVNSAADAIVHAAVTS